MRVNFISVLVTLVTIHVVLCSDFQPGNWGSCKEGNERSPSMTDTSTQVEKLRAEMRKLDVEAYIVPSGDFHLSEFVSDYDKRRQYISGFSGSSGTAVVTLEYAALWTDGRYFLQAEGELGCDWILMRESESGVPDIADWLGSFLPKHGDIIIGACPYFFGNNEWKKLSKQLSGHGLTLNQMTPDLIDVIWTEDRPAFPSTTINPLPRKYTGLTWQKKVTDIKMEMERQNVDLLVITGLDEIAWTFNMRATDIQGFVNDPFFYSLLLIDRQEDSLRLYIKDYLRKLPEMTTDPVASDNVMTHLNTNRNGTCPGMKDTCVEVKEYDFDLFIDDVTEAAERTNVSRVWVSYHCNYAIFKSIPKGKVHVGNTPAALQKAQKNNVEIKGMKNAHIRDAVALIRFIAKLEKEVKDGVEWTEMSAMDELSRLRSEADMSRGDSFAAISSVGPNAAINHYFANNVTNRKITKNETYLLDSGGQYLDGTTDVTRTFLFSKPTDFIKECYTRVLMGQIDLALAVWNQGKFGRELDAFARKPLWDVGLIYRHGTGHGIGAYLSVHEGPGRISNYHAVFPWDIALDEGMFFSDEPGYYEKGKFGIRLENIFFVKTVETKYTFPGSKMLGFETVTLVPYELDLIDYKLLSQRQVDWLNDYNKQCKEIVGPLLKEVDKRAYNWLKKRTRTIHYLTGLSAGSVSTPNLTSGFLFLILASLYNIY